MSYIAGQAAIDVLQSASIAVLYVWVWREVWRRK